jgi:hypothetical protein
MTRSQIGLVLRHWGYGAVASRDGCGVFLKINSEPIDLVLLPYYGNEVCAVNIPILSIKWTLA